MLSFDEVISINKLEFSIHHFKDTQKHLQPVVTAVCQQRFVSEIHRRPGGESAGVDQQNLDSSGTILK